MTERNYYNTNCIPYVYISLQSVVENLIQKPTFEIKNTFVQVFSGARFGNASWCDKREIYKKYV